MIVLPLLDYIYILRCYSSTKLSVLRAGLLSEFCNGGLLRGSGGGAPSATKILYFFGKITILILF